jgi:hypothetical protein
MDMADQGIDRVMATHIPVHVRDHVPATYIPAGDLVVDVLSADTPAAGDPVAGDQAVVDVQAVGQAAEITGTNARPLLLRKNANAGTCL